MAYNLNVVYIRAVYNNSNYIDISSENKAPSIYEFSLTVV